MPVMQTEEQRNTNEARAVWHAANGHRIRGFFARLWTTPLYDAIHGRLWPNCR